MLHHFFENTYSHLKQKPWLFAAFIAILNVVFKFYNVGEASYWLDEAFSVFHAQKNLTEMLDVLSHDQNPPFYFVLLHFWIKIFGITELGTRSLSAVLSCIAAVALFYVSRKHFGMQVAIVVCLLFSFSPVHLYYAHESRCFALVTLLCLLSFNCFLEMLQEGKINIYHIALLGILNALLLYSHFITLFILVTQGLLALYFLFANKKRWLFIGFTISGAISVALFLPWLRYAFANMPKAGVYWLNKPSFSNIIITLIEFAGGKSMLYVDGLLLLAFTILCTKSAKFRDHINYFYLLIATLWFVVPVFGDYLLAGYTPVYIVRYVLYASLGYMLLLAFIFTALPLGNRIKIVMLLVFCMCGFITISLNPYKGEDWKFIMPEIKQEKTKKSVVLIEAWYQYVSFSYYYDDAIFKNYDRIIDKLKSDNIYCVNDAAIMRTHDFSKADKIILVQAHEGLVDPDGKLLKAVTAMPDFSLEKKVLQYGGVKMQVFRNERRKIIKSDTTYFGPPYVEKNGWKKGKDVFIYKDKQVLFAGKREEYSAGVTTPIYLSTSGGHEMVLAKVSALCSAEGDLNNSPASIVISIDTDEGKNLQYTAIRLAKCIKTQQEWNNIKWECRFSSEVLPKAAKLKFYLWNKDVNNRVYLSDIKLEIIKNAME